MRAAGPIAASFFALAASAAAAAAPPPKAQAAGCTPVVKAEPLQRPFPYPDQALGPAALKALLATTEQRFAAAAHALCTAGTVTPRDLSHFRRLILRSAEGTAEPMLFTKESSPGAAIMDFSYAAGPPPSVAQLRTALRCWKRPNARGCDFGD